jgi:hypothetical protein
VRVCVQRGQLRGVSADALLPHQHVEGRLRVGRDALLHRVSLPVQVSRESVVRAEDADAQLVIGPSARIPPGTGPAEDVWIDLE